VKRVAHKAGNTGDVFDAALRAGVDMLELDVLPERPDGTGELLLAHDYDDLARRRDDVMTLDEGLAKVCGTGLELNVDLKLTGYEDRVVAALREHDARERALISTMEEPTLRRVRELDPGIRLGWSVPRVRKDPFRSPFTAVPAIGMVQVLRRTMPRKVAAAVRSGRVDAIMANQHLVTPALVRAVLGAGGEVYVWTVDDADRIAELEALGVSAVITNRPEMFPVQASGPHVRDDPAPSGRR
jgi:glycerophosphoryl diester phosphodiesterase